MAGGSCGNEAGSYGLTDASQAKQNNAGATVPALFYQVSYAGVPAPTTVGVIIRYNGDLEGQVAVATFTAQNSGGTFDGVIRAQLEETGMGYGLEVELIGRARQLELLTTPYVFSEEQARTMTDVGADIVVCHMGLTTGGTIGAETALTLEGCVPLIDAWSKAARIMREDVIVLCHGGPIATPEDAAFILRACRGCKLNVQGREWYLLPERQLQIRSIVDRKTMSPRKAQNDTLFRLPIDNNRKEIDPDDRRLKDRVADNIRKYELTESESLVFGTGFGVSPDVRESPDGTLFVVSSSTGNIYEIRRK